MQPADQAAFATTVYEQLAAISRRLQEEAATTEERFTLLVDTCKRAGLVLSEEAAFDFVPSPLIQMIENMHDRIRYAEFVHDAQAVVLHHFNVGVPAVPVPMDLFDPALLMLESLWQSESFPYQASTTLRLVK